MLEIPHGEKAKPDLAITTANLFQNAKSYAAAAGFLLEQNVLNDSLAPAFYLLIGYSLELSIKALCLQGGCLRKGLEKIRERGTRFT
jgi:hypothetical protein